LKLLLTGHDGYLGAVMTPMLLAAGHEVVGLDTGLFGDCLFGGDDAMARVPTLATDLRDVGPRQLEGFDAVIHLGGLSNDPLGDIDPDLTYRINEEAFRWSPGAHAAWPWRPAVDRARAGSPPWPRQDVLRA
jgi:nucleoside-diphosphate-sugar epimerase